MFPVTSQDRILSVLDIVGTIGHFWGYLTALVTWSCTVETLYDGFAVGAVLLVSCIFLTVFEVYVPVHVHFLRRIVSDENNWFKKVDSLEFKGVSKMKTVVYACLGVLSCLEPNEVWLAALSGIFVLILAAFCGLTLLRKSIAARSSVSPYSRYESGIEQNGTNSIDLRT